MKEASVYFDESRQFARWARKVHTSHCAPAEFRAILHRRPILLRTAGAVHLTTAQDLGEHEVRTN